MPTLIERDLHGRRAGSEELAAGGLVRRRGLYRRLSGPANVILVCAPAGSGKTVLIRSWIEAAGLRDRAGWVSVRRGERDAQRFWLAVIDALADQLGIVSRVDPAPGFDGEAVVERFTAELASLQEPAVLVIDDLHELRCQEALAWLETLLSSLPAGLRVVLATREDPRLGLHRFRLAGGLTELRGPDLRFTFDETGELLRAARITLSDGGLTLLYERTEGWAAGLRLAAISLGRHPDPERFVTEFCGSERTVAGYLLAEVLEQQPAEVRELLLRTSILDRVSGPLADYLTGGSGSERILQQLEDANAFVTSIDAGRSWFRYHHLFADLLQLELRRVAPTSVSALHRAAAQWHRQEGNIVEAIQHAQAARDWPQASALLADHHVDLTLDGHTETVCQLLRAFPDEFAAGDAELALVCGAATLLDQRREEGSRYLDLAQQLADSVPRERRRRFDVVFGVLQLMVARQRGELGTALNAIEGMEAALAALPATEQALSDSLRSAALLNLGVTELWSSRFGDARRDLEQALMLARRAQRPWLEIPCLGHLAIAAPWAATTLADGLALSEEAIGIADAHGWSEDPVIITALATGAFTLTWLGRFDEAERRLDRAERTLHPDGEPGTELIVHHTRGLLGLAQGRYEEALTAFRAAERMQELLADRHPFMLRTQARLLQSQVRMGLLDTAWGALAEFDDRERGASELRATAAVIHLAASEPERALDVLAPVIDSSAPRMHSVMAGLEAQVLDAVARERLGDRRGAEASLERALELAEPEGLVLPFILAPVRELLEGLPRYRTGHATLRRTILDALSGSAAPSRGAPAPLLDELSEAELRIVRYLPSNLKAPEIAAELCLSANTVRTHIRHVYAKLGAHDRNDAVNRARELRLLARR